MTLEILTPEKEIFKGDIKSVTLPGALGEFQMKSARANYIDINNGSSIIVTKKMKKIFLISMVVL